MDAAANVIYVANQASNSVTVINGSTLSISATVALPNAPTKLAVDAANHRVLVLTQAGDGTGSLIDISESTNAIAATVAVGNTPTDLLVDVAAGQILVANGNGNTVSAIGIGSLSVLATVNVGTFPDVLAAGSAGTVYVANRASNSLSVLAESTDTVAATVTLPNAPSAMATNTVTGQMLVANAAADGTAPVISVVDESSNAVTATWTLSSRADSVIVSASGTVYATTFATGSMLAMWASRVMARLAVGAATKSSGIATDAAAGKIYVSNESGASVTAVDEASNTVATPAVVGSWPTRLAVNKTTNKAYVANATAGTISVIDGATSAVTATILDNGDPSDVAVNATTNTVFIADSGSTTLTIINGSTNQVSKILDLGSAPQGVAVNETTNTIYATTTNSVLAINGSTYATTTISGSGTTDCTRVAVNATTNTVYVVDNDSAGSITVINGSTNTVTTSIATHANSMRDMAVNTSTNTVYVSDDGGNSGGSSSVVFINGANNTVTTSAWVGVYSSGVAVDTASNVVFVGAEDPDAVKIIDGTNGTALTSISLPSVNATNTDPDALGFNPVTQTLYSGNYGAGTVSVIKESVPRQIGSGWASLRVPGVGDFSGDGKPDVLAVNPSTGDLWMFAGTGNDGFAPEAVRVGTGWSQFTQVVGPADFNGDGKPDVLAVNSSGVLFLYAGNGAGGWLPGTGTQIGSGWSSLKIVGIGDFSGDGKPDVLAVNPSTGDLWMFAGTGNGGFAPEAVRVGTGWSQFTQVIGPADFNGDGKADVLAVNSSGVLFLYAGNGAGGWLPGTGTQIGSGWSGSIMSGIADFDGDGKADLLYVGSDGNLYNFRGNGTGGWL